MSLLGTLLQQESSGTNVANTSATTSSGQAQGYFQITQGTWGDFGGYQYAASPLQASYAQQAAIASNIPLTRWAPSTVAALQASGATIDPNATLGANLAANGESFADFNPGTGQIAQGPVDQSSGISAGSSSSSNPGGGVATNSNLPTYQQMTSSGGIGDASVTAENTAAAASAGAEGVAGLPISAGLQPGTATAVSSWLTGIETTATDISKATGNAFSGAVTAAEDAVANFIGGIQNWFIRAGLILLGIVLIAIALGAIAWNHGGKEIAINIAKGAAV